MKLPITLLSACIFLAQFSFGQKKNKPFKKEFYFASASYELDSAELAKSSKYLKLLDKFNLTGIEIYGFADSDGNEKANLKLSQDRINTLTTLLKARGYEAKQKVEAKGEENPVYDNNTEEKFKNRRVEIIAYYSSKKSSKTSKKVKKVVKEKPVLVAAKKQEKLSVEDFKKGKTINLPSVQFYGGTANFLPGAEKTLDKVVPILLSNPEMKIEVAGHICCGNEMELSVLRAKVVYDYLVKKGVDKKMLSYAGYNNTQPSYGDIMDVRNRRVEMRIL